MVNYLEISNSMPLWLMALPTVAMVGVQAFIFSKKAYNAAPLVDLSHEQCRHAFRIGAISAVGPAVAVFIVMIGMMAVVGAPMTWLRLNIIGSATTELTATTVGAKAMGIQLNTPEYGLTAFAASVWTMTLNGCGWLLFCGLFTHKMGKIMDHFTGGNIAVLSEICGAAVLGTASYLAVDQGLRSSPNVAAVIAAIVSMSILMKVSPKWLKEYNMGIAMIFGMIAAVAVLKLGGQ